MMTTEEEAKTKICQEAISAQLHDDKVADASRCIGSACMAWRWQDNLSDRSVRGPRGYCGKAGRP
jgi:hypothetical protein